MSKPANRSGMTCPLWRKPCAKVCHTCEFWEQIRGKHPQTGHDMDHWGCTLKLHTLLQIEHTLATRQTTASIDQLRKEVHANADQSIVGALSHLNSKLNPTPLVVGSSASGATLIEN